MASTAGSMEYAAMNPEFAFIFSFRGFRDFFAVLPATSEGITSAGSVTIPEITAMIC